MCQGGVPIPMRDNYFFIAGFFRMPISDLLLISYLIIVAGPRVVDFCLLYDNYERWRFTILI